MPSLRVKELHLEVGDLKAHLALHARLANVVSLDAGVDACLADTRLQLKDVEAEARLKVSLREVRKIFDRTLASVDRNPQMIESTAKHAGEQEHEHEHGQEHDQEQEQHGNGASSKRRSLPARALSRAVAAPRALLRSARAVAGALRQGNGR